MHWPLLAVNLAVGVVFLRLAIWAEGGPDVFFGDNALTAFFFVTIAFVAVAWFSKGNLSGGLREDRENRWVFLAFGGFSIAAIVVCFAFDRRNILTLDGDVVRWLGVGLYTVGGVLRLWPVFVLGRRFSGLVAIQEGHRLVTDGIYARIRNPSYLGLIVNAVGMALVFRSLPGVVLELAMLWPLIARMDAEERLLEETFGEEYRAYRARTSRLVPGVY